MTGWAMLVLAMGMATHADTSFTVTKSSRLTLHHFAGDVTVRPWGRPVVRVQAEGERPFALSVDRNGTSYELRGSLSRGIPGRVDYAITAPPWMSLDLADVHGDLVIQGWQSDVIAKTVEGDVSLSGGRGLVSLETVTGGVKVVGAKGRLELSSVQDDVDARDIEGEITAESVNGGVLLDRVHSKLVQAQSVNGSVQFTGYVEGDGRYKFATHSGDLDVALPADADASVSVSTFNGDFESTFPVQVMGTGPGRTFKFTLGSGKAVVELESFGGTINLKQAGDDGKRRRRGFEYRYRVDEHGKTEFKERAEERGK